MCEAVALRVAFFSAGERTGHHKSQPSPPRLCSYTSSAPPLSTKMMCTRCQSAWLGCLRYLCLAARTSKACLSACRWQPRSVGR
jgi:hypothetical protein